MSSLDSSGVHIHNPILSANMACSRRYGTCLTMADSSLPSAKAMGCLLFLLTFSTCCNAWDSSDLELFDLVEEIQQNFYDVLEIDRSASPADIRRAYRRLSLQLHPDKNKEEDAEEKFRQLVAVAEVLRDEEMRKKYDEVLEHGLPDWRQPVYYYRRVRKMGLLELSVLLSAILTVGHYLVLWSMYFERRLELEALIKPKKERKSKKASKQQSQPQPSAEQLTQTLLEDPSLIQKPLLTDILPWRLACFSLKSLLGLPGLCRSAVHSWQHYLETRRREKEDDGSGAEDDEEEESSKRKDQGPRERQRLDPAMYDYDRTANAQVTMATGGEATQTNGSVPGGETSSSKKVNSEWSTSEVTSLVKLMAKFPGGTTDRWIRIAQELKKPVDIVTKKAKQMKSGKFVANVDASAQGITGGIQHTLISKKTGSGMTDDIITHSTNQRREWEESQPYEYSSASSGRHRTSKAVKSSDGDQASGDNDVSNTGLQHKEVDELVHAGVESCAWTQRQQKILEKAMQVYPRGVDERWEKIADAVPGKTKEECIVRYKELVEVVKRRKQATAQ